MQIFQIQKHYLQKIVCDKMNLDINQIINAAKTKKFGFMPFYPGPGLGGHCIPIDPHILTWKAKKYGVQTKFINLSAKINSKMPNFVLKKLLDDIKKNYKKVNKIKVFILGAAYKKNINDYRESPSIEFIKLLINKKIKFIFNDPYINSLMINQKKFQSYEINKKNLNKCDYTILITDHDIYNYKFIYSNSKKIIDCRNKFKKDKKIIYA